MNSLLSPRLMLRSIAIILVLIVVGIGGVGAAHPATGQAASPPQAAAPQPPVPQETCPPPSPTALATPAFTPGPGCTARPRPTDLNADISVNGNTTSAVFTNRSPTCSYPIGLATYQ